MVRSSNAISRETCQVQNVDDESVIKKQFGTLSECSRPPGCVPPPEGNETAAPDPSDDATDRSQSPHSSDDAREQNLAEPRGAGR